MDTVPKPADNENMLLARIASRLHTFYSSAQEPPRTGDNNIVLLTKIVRILNAQGPGTTPPLPSDSENDLLRKWCKLVNAGL